VEKILEVSAVKLQHRSIMKVLNKCNYAWYVMHDEVLPQEVTIKANHAKYSNRRMNEFFSRERNQFYRVFYAEQFVLVFVFSSPKSLYV